MLFHSHGVTNLRILGGMKQLILSLSILIVASLIIVSCTERDLPSPLEADDATVVSILINDDNCADAVKHYEELLDSNGNSFDYILINAETMGYLGCDEELAKVIGKRFGVSPRMSAPTPTPQSKHFLEEIETYVTEIIDGNSFETLAGTVFLVGNSPSSVSEQLFPPEHALRNLLQPQNPDYPVRILVTDRNDSGRIGGCAYILPTGAFSVWYSVDEALIRQGVAKPTYISCPAQHKPK